MLQANQREEAYKEQIKQLTDTLDRKIEALRQEIRAIDRAQTAKRRKLVGDLGDAIKAMAYDAWNGPSAPSQDLSAP